MQTLAGPVLIQDRKNIPENSDRLRGKKRLIWLALILPLLCGGYWLKCQLGINVFETISISSYSLLKYLKDDVLIVEKPGVIINDNFDRFRLLNHWSKSALRRCCKTIGRIADGGFGEHSRCLHISSECDCRWVYPYRKLFSTTKGEAFFLAGRVFLEAGSRKARFSIAAFDKDRNAITWSLAASSVKVSGEWIKVQKQFTIDDERIRFITFRISGSRGRYRFDNLLFSRVK
jgi:hypothetical protein